MQFPKIKKIIICCLLLLNACGGGSSSQGGADDSCDGSCADNFLTSSEVELLLKQAVTSATKEGVSGTFAIVDRVGNVLALYQMQGAAREVLIDGQIGAVGGLEGARVPAIFSAISKAGTGAYLSSQGNAFSSRTASQIIQEHFDPGEKNQAGGPLFGVQFSQLVCSDITVSDSSRTGPRAMPLGLSADPGGFPLYKNGVVVGGIGVEVDAKYTLDRNIRDRDLSVDELIAFAASAGFHAPSTRTADRITPGGKSLRYSDIDNVQPMGEIISELDSKSFVVASPFSDGKIHQGTSFGNHESGILKTTRLGIPAAILVNSSGANRFPSRDGAISTGGEQLKASEVEAILDSAFFTAHQARAAIRRPLDTPARVSIWIVDQQGVAIGFTRSEDAPVFGVDVALQKARTAAFFSSADAGSKLEQLGLGEYVAKAKEFIGPTALNGNVAFTDRAIGNLSRPFFLDGIDGNSNGPYSLAFPCSATGRTWSPFNTGLQLDLILQSLLAPLSGVLPERCANLGNRLANGIQIFPGSVPLYKNGVLVGAIGVSGDGIDQDDLVAFYGASRKGLDAVGYQLYGDKTLGYNAPIEIRSDNLIVSSLQQRLRYVNCPEAPFIESNQQNICEGL